MTKITPLYSIYFSDSTHSKMDVSGQCLLKLAKVYSDWCFGMGHWNQYFVDYMDKCGVL